MTGPFGRICEFYCREATDRLAGGNRYAVLLFVAPLRVPPLDPSR